VCDYECIVINNPFRLSPAIMIYHPISFIDAPLLALQNPIIGYQGGNPLIGKSSDMIGWLTINN